jgi:hypothetical protein
MRSVTVQIPAAEFSGTMTVIAEWLDANGYVPARYKYNHSEDAVVVIVDFSSAVAADAFEMRFAGVYNLVSQFSSPDSRRRLATSGIPHGR